MPTDDAFFIARTVRDGDFTPFQPGNEETEQLKVLCRQRRFVSHELSNAKRRLNCLTCFRQTWYVHNHVAQDARKSMRGHEAIAAGIEAFP